MDRKRHVILAACAVAAALAVLLLYQSAGAEEANEPAGVRPDGAGPAAVRDKSAYRKLAPGIEIAIPAERHKEDTFSVHDAVEILQGIPNLNWTPKLSPSSQTLKEKATATVFRSRMIWYLEFTFKPVRMIWVDEPQASGKMQRKLVWYMIYHVKNKGGHFVPQRQADGTYDVTEQDADVRFFPLFVLDAPEYKKAYLDRLIPVASDAIQQKEDPNRKLLNSVEIGTKPIPVSTEREDRSVWGVATWEDLDPRIDFFSVSVQGLTNAYKWIDPPGAYTAGDPPGTGRVLLQRTLVLNFWRPGDEYNESERTIHYGIPGKVDYSWVYR
jgi:hypothetical protein